jgi:hypothetical protein
MCVCGDSGGGGGRGITVSEASRKDRKLIPWESHYLSRFVLNPCLYIFQECGPCKCSEHLNYTMEYVYRIGTFGKHGWPEDTR